MFSSKWLSLGTSGHKVRRSEGWRFDSWGPFLEGPEKFSGPESLIKNLKPYVSRTVLFTQSINEQS